MEREPLALDTVDPVDVVNDPDDLTGGQQVGPLMARDLQLRHLLESDQGVLAIGRRRQPR